MLSPFDEPEIYCDAPPYAVVRACKQCGFYSPLDVRWCHLSQVLARTDHCQSGFLLRTCQLFFWKLMPNKPHCSCGLPLPYLTEYGFTFRSVELGDYLLCQCRRCKTIFWDVAVPIPEWVKEDVLMSPHPHNPQISCPRLVQSLLEYFLG